MGRCITVIGTHCSGTSVVAGVLHRLGVNMGDQLVAPGAANPFGFFEDAELVECNQQIVDWRDPKRLRFLPEDARAYRQIIANRARQDVWGVKDPRLCLLGRYWFDALDDTGIEWRAIFVVRNPESSVASLAQRERWPHERAKEVTKAHLGAMWPLYYQYAEKSAIVCYGTLLERPEDVARRLAEIAGVDPSDKQIEHAAAIVRPELCHHGS